MLVQVAAPITTIGEKAHRGSRAYLQYYLLDCWRMASGISRVSAAAKSVMNVRHKKCRTLKIQYSVQSADRSWPKQKLSIRKILENNNSELQYWPK